MYAKLFSAETINKYYVPMFFQFCSDPVAEVQVESAKQAKYLIQKLKDNLELFDQFIKKVLEYKTANRYFLR